MDESHALIERFGPTIDALPPVLRHMGAPDGAGLVCWNVEDPQRWCWGDDPDPNERCELSHVYVSRFGDDSDKWRAIRLAAWALSLWDAVITPEPETPESDTLVFAISLGAAIRELEEFGLVDDGGRTLSDLAGYASDQLAKLDRGNKTKAEQNKARLQPIDDRIKELLTDDRALKGPRAAWRAFRGLGTPEDQKRRGHKYHNDLWARFKKNNELWLTENRPDLL